MAEKISVEIALDGGKDVEKQLAAIGETGAEAFSDLSEATKQTGQDLDKVEGSATKASESISRISLEAVKTSAEIAKLGLEITKLGVEIGLAVARHKTLAQSLFSLASGASTAVRGLGLLAPELATLATSVGVLVVAVGALTAALSAANAAAEAATAPYSKLSQSLETLSANTGRTFDSLQQGKAAFAELGISGEAFVSIITKINEAVSSFKVGEKIRDQAREALEAQKQLLEALLELEAAGGQQAPPGTRREIEDLDKKIKLQTAEKKVQDAIEKSAALAANSLKTLVPLIEAIVAGQRDITFDSLTTAAGKIDAVTAAMSRAALSGKTAEQVLNDFIANADRLSAIQIGEKFGITAEQVDNIRLLRDSVTEIWQRAKSQPPLFTPEARKALQDLRKATAQLTQEQMRLQQAWDSSLFARFGAGYLTMIEKMKMGIVRWAADFLETGNTFPARFAAWFNALPAAVDQSIAQVRALWNSFVTSLPDISWEGIKQGAAAAWDWIKQKVAEGKQAVLDFAASLPSIAWDAITSGATAAWEAIKQGAADAKTAVLEFAASLPGTAWEAFKVAGVAAWDAIIAKVKEFLGLAPKATGGGAGASVPALARGGFIGGRGTGTSDSNLAWLSRGEYIMPARAVARPGVLSFLEAMRRSGRIPGFAAGGMVGGGGTDTVSVSVNNMVQAIEKNTEAIQSQSTVIMELSRIVNSMVQAVSSALSQKGRASGGLLGGRGTGTSDSNLAWVSRGEHIMPARAVRQPGVLAFLEALRRSGGNLADVLDGMGRFALGGMVPRAIPAFATGGLAGGMSNVTIQFPGLPEIGGLRASSSAVGEMRRVAALAQVRSGGRKPSRYS